MPLITTLALAVLSLMPPATPSQTCAGTPPVAGWVCYSGPYGTGWVPPNIVVDYWHGPNDPYAATGGGARLPDGSWVPASHPLAAGAIGAPAPLPAPTPAASDFPTLSWGPSYQLGAVEYFAPPMILRPNQAPQSGAGKVFRPSTPHYTGPLVIIESMGTVDPPGLGYPGRMHVEDLTVWGYPGQTCVEVRGANITVERLTAVGCDDGLRLEWAVNVAIRDSLLTHNARGLHVKGNGPATLTAPHSITTVTIHATRIAASTGSEAVLIGHALGVIFQQVIIEGNMGAAVRAAPGWPGAAISSVVLRDVWFEANGGGIVGQGLTAEGVTRTW